MIEWIYRNIHIGDHSSSPDFFCPDAYTTMSRKSLSGATSISCSFDLILKNARSFIGSRSLTMDLAFCANTGMVFAMSPVFKMKLNLTLLFFLIIRLLVCCPLNSALVIHYHDSEHRLVLLDPVESFFNVDVLHLINLLDKQWAHL